MPPLQVLCDDSTSRNMGLCSRFHDLPQLRILFAVLLSEYLDFERKLLQLELVLD